MYEKGIEISGSQNQRVVISSHGVEIRHKGRPITAEMVGIGAVYLVIDSSGSMTEGDKLDQAKKGAMDFAKDAKTKGYSIGLIKFDSIATHLCEPQREISVLPQHLNAIESGGTTNMAEAIHLAHQKLTNKLGVRVMVIITDGMPDSDGDALEAAKKAKKNRVDIIAIGTDDADRDFLRKLASRTELGVKVSRVQFEQAIVSAAKMLSLPSGSESKYFNLPSGDLRRLGIKEGSIKCCACQRPIRGEFDYRFVTLDFLAPWEYPTMEGKAVSILCLKCFERGEKPSFAIEWKCDKEGNKIWDVHYHLL